MTGKVTEKSRLLKRGHSSVSLIFLLLLILLSDLIDAAIESDQIVSSEDRQHNSVLKVNFKNVTEDENSRERELLQQLLQERNKRERAEALLDEAQLKLDSLEASFRVTDGKGQGLSQLHIRVIELAERVAAEHFKVVQLQKSRSLLLRHVQILTCCLSHNRIMNRRLFHKLQLELSKEKSHNLCERKRLKSQIYHTSRRYQHQISSSEKLIHNSQKRIRHLRNTILKMKNLCESLERRYQTIIFEMGQEIRSIAQLLCPSELPHLHPLQSGLSASELGKWFAAIQNLSHQTQHYILYKLSKQDIAFSPDFAKMYKEAEYISTPSAPSSKTECNVLSKTALTSSNDSSKLQSMNVGDQCSKTNHERKVDSFSLTKGEADENLQIDSIVMASDKDDLNANKEEYLEESSINGATNDFDGDQNSELIKEASHTDSVTCQIRNVLPTETSHEDLSTSLNIRIVEIMDDLKGRLLELNKHL